MRKHELLNYLDDTLTEKLFGFCYARTNDSYEAQDLCSDIIFALIKAAGSDGAIEHVYPFIWRTAQNVYADFSRKRRQHADLFCEGDPVDLLSGAAWEEIGGQSGEDELLAAVYRQLSFLTKTYREAMVLFYLDGLSTAEIAKRQSTSETAVRQRLFTARKKVRNEVNEMMEASQKPIALDKMEYILWGTGDPCWGDPRTVCTRQFSKHILWLCHKKPMNAREIADELNVPTVYVEEELEILAAGQNNQYGLLRKMGNGKFAINFILLEREVIERVHAIYSEQLPHICRSIADFIEAHRDEYLAFPYLNKKTDFNLILWQQIHVISSAFSKNVEDILRENYFSAAGTIERPFSVYGYVDYGKYYGGGWDGVTAAHVCGYSKIRLNNIYCKRVRRHFDCGLNIAADPLIQLALRAIDGLDISLLSEDEKEHASKAIECGYLYREGGLLYTKILVTDEKDANRLFDLSQTLHHGCFAEEAEAVAKKLAETIRKTVPNYLIAEWPLFNSLASMPVLDGLVEALIEKGILVPPEDGVGAEGCWMTIAR